ncbi:MAG: lytic transglycosylase domain-containing protein, partial [Geminicoccaceae bacterium]
GRIMTWFRFASVTVVAGALLATTVSTASGRQPIPDVYVATAELHGIQDPSLLYAIATQESGRLDPRSGALKPWPWTLNVAGQGYYYADMTEVWDALAGFMQDKPRHIGIGLVQVTWPFNPDILWDPYTALEPSTNLTLGARILRACYDRLGDWWHAVGCYHSPTAKIALAYQKRVRRHWLALNRSEESS